MKNFKECKETINLNDYEFSPRMDNGYDSPYYTGGIKNKEFDKLYLGTIRNSFACVKLYEQYKPATVKDAILTISNIKAKKVKFDNVYVNNDVFEVAYQFYYKTNYKYSYKECFDFCVGILIINSLKGQLMEDAAAYFLNEHLPNDIKVVKTPSAFDSKFAIDLLLVKTINGVVFKENVICGIQVKPESYKHFKHDELKKHNQKVNELLKFKTLYLHYSGSYNVVNKNLSKCQHNCQYDRGRKTIKCLQYVDLQDNIKEILKIYENMTYRLK